MSEKIGIYVSGLLILACFSYLFKDNKLYTYTEHIYVGFGAAQAIVMGWQNISQGAIEPMKKGQWEEIIPIILGCLLYTRFRKSISYLARLPMAFLMGVASGVTITGTIEAQFIKQVRATILPLTNLDNLIIVLGTAATVAFFLFIPLNLGGWQKKVKTPSDRLRPSSPGSGSKERTQRSKAMSAISTAGRAVMMIAFGSSYGFIVMSRLSYLIARLQFLLSKVVPVLPD